MRSTDRFVESVSRLQIFLAVKIQSENNLQTPCSFSPPVSGIFRVELLRY